MTSALHAAVATLPEPIHSAHANIIAESILRTAKGGERDMATLQRIALMELHLTGPGLGGHVNGSRTPQAISVSST